MSKESLIETAIEYTSAKLDLLQEWKEADEYEKELIEDELSAEYGMDFDEDDN